MQAFCPSPQVQRSCFMTTRVAHSVSSRTMSCKFRALQLNVHRRSTTTAQLPSIRTNSLPMFSQVRSYPTRWHCPQHKQRHHIPTRSTRPVDKFLMAWLELTGVRSSLRQPVRLLYCNCSCSQGCIKVVFSLGSIPLAVLVTLRPRTDRPAAQTELTDLGAMIFAETH